MVQEDILQEKVALQVRELIDRNKARERFIELSKDKKAELTEWATTTKPVENANKLFAITIRGHDVYKKALVLQAVSLPQPFHILGIGDPACGKSEIAEAFVMILEDSRYVLATKMTAAGLTLSRLGDELKIGTLPECHMGLAVVDELNRAHREDGGALFSVMQAGHFSVDKAGLKVPFMPSNVAICGLANPSGDYWQGTHPHDIRNQLPFSSKALLTRFHLPIIFLKPEVGEFHRIAEHQVDVAQKHIPENAIKGKDLEMWQLYVHYLRRMKINEWENPKKTKEMIAAFATECDRQDNPDGRGQNLAVPISPRLTLGVIRIAQAYAKSRMDTTLKIRDAIKAILLMSECLLPCGLNVEKAFAQIKKATKLEIGFD